MGRPPDFPTVAEVFAGVVIATIEEAMTRAAVEREDAIVLYEHWWKLSELGKTWVYDNREADRVAVTFSEHGVVALFQSHESRRNRVADSAAAPAVAYLEGMPPALAWIAREETLPWFVDEIDGVLEPAITAAMWATTGRFSAVEFWSGVWEAGAELIEQYLPPEPEALADTADVGGWSLDETALLRSVYRQRIGATSLPLRLAEPERWAFRAKLAKHDAEVIDLLAAIDIVRD